MVKNQTSFYEQAIFYYITQVIPEAVNRYKYNAIEADIFIPIAKCVIEYDGEHWHKNRIDLDNQKNSFFNKEGIFVIRIRDVGLPQLSPFDGVVFNHHTHANSGGDGIVVIIEGVMHTLSKRVDDIALKEKLSAFSLSHEAFLESSPDIDSVFHSEKVSDNVATACGIALWDYSKNKRLMPTNITNNYRHRVFFKCPEGYSRFEYPSIVLINQGHCDNDCGVCPRYYCPLISNCEINCNKKKEYIFDYLSGRLLIPSNKFNSIRRMLLSSSACTDAIEYSVTSSDPSIIARFEALFFLDIEKQCFITHLRCIKEDKDLQSLKILIHRYPHACPSFDALAFDVSLDLQDKFIDFCEWLHEFKKNNPTPWQEFRLWFLDCFTEYLTVSGVLSSAFAKKIQAFIFSHNAEFGELYSLPQKLALSIIE